jgi:hypothetical protein
LYSIGFLLLISFCLSLCPSSLQQESQYHIPLHDPLPLTSTLFPSPVGVDIGGLFKDFLSDLSARVFDPSYGLFSVTSDNLLYPNPSAILLYPEPGELEALYGFLGEFRHNLNAFQ